MKQDTIEVLFLPDECLFEVLQQCRGVFSRLIDVSFIEVSTLCWYRICVASSGTACFRYASWWNSSISARLIMLLNSAKKAIFSLLLTWTWGHRLAMVVLCICQLQQDRYVFLWTPSSMLFLANPSWHFSLRLIWVCILVTLLHEFGPHFS